jgi:transcriptional regulator with XRE-family HTH domain
VARRVRAPLPVTEDALAVLGAQISAARKELGWTLDQLAERVGVTRQLISRIESGGATPQIGTVFDAATICGVPLFAPDAAQLSRLADAERNRAALLPARVRPQKVALIDDF